MKEMVLYKLADMVLTAVAAGIERESVLAKIEAMEVDGASAEQITEAIKQMRDDALGNLQTEIRNTPD